MRKNRTGREPAGFAVVELLVVFAVAATVASIGIPVYLHSIDTAQSKQCQANRTVIEKAEIQFLGDHNRPSASLTELLEAGYMQKGWACPVQGQYLWTTEDVEDPAYPTLGCSIHFWQETSAGAEAGSALMFAHEFDDMQSLTVLKGKWAVEDGSLVTGRNGDHRIVFGDAGWSDYEVRTTATLARGKGFGIFYRADGEKRIDGYLFQYDPGRRPDQFLVRKVVDGRYRNILQKVNMPDGFAVYNQSHDIRIRVQGDHHTVQVDGAEVLDFRDSTWSTGMAGFRKWDRSDVSFSSVSVIELGDG